MWFHIGEFHVPAHTLVVMNLHLEEEFWSSNRVQCWARRPQDRGFS